MTVDNNTITVEHLIETLSITKIGVFIWNLETNHVIYSKEWAEIVGYEQDELEPHVSTWESMLFLDDLRIAEDSLNKYLAGDVPIYEAEFRIIRKDGTVIWGHDKGKITKYSEDGRPLILCGVLQDITSRKQTENLLKEKTEVLNLSIEVAEFGTWDWDVKNNSISYNDEYLKMLGYTQEEMNGSFLEWEKMNHPQDRIRVLKMLDEFVSGKRATYECETRMLHKDGYYIWTKDVGKIISKDKNGIASRIIGGYLNIDNLKNSQLQLKKALNELENHQLHLEKEIEARTKTLVEHDKLLVAVNDVSQILLTSNEENNFDLLLLECLKKLTFAFNTTEFALWHSLKLEEGQFFYQTHLYKQEFDEKIVFDVEDMREYIIKLLDEEGAFSIHTKDDNIIINYNEAPEELRKILETEKSISHFMSSLNETWNKDIKIQIENIETSIAVPIFLYDNLIGFISTGSNRGNIQYSESHVKMLDISGKLFANATRKYEIDKQLRNAHEEALLSSQAKSNFLANMSHEIRTPLNAILGMSEIVIGESTGRNIRNYAMEIKKASKSLLAIINDILDISKIESGKFEIIEEEYSISSLLKDIISLLKIRLEDKPILLTTFIQSDLPNILYGDEIRIKQILINLISNAIKFTKMGNINLAVECVEQNDDTLELVFTVSDTGIGISEEDIQRLFIQFERVDTKKNRNIEGTGLGLAITKQLCELMHGTISVESKQNVGSTFKVRIPQKYKQLEPIVNKAKNAKILVFENREVCINSFKRVMDDLNASCTVCTNESELTQYLSKQSFDYLFAPIIHREKIKNLCSKMNIVTNIIFMVEPNDLTVYSDETVVSLPINCIQIAKIFGNTNTNVQKKEETYSFIAPTAKVLVVDDNRINLLVAEGLMKPYNIILETAEDGAIAVEMIKNNKYDLVFMDHMMPEMDGIEATAVIRKIEDDYYKKLPIIAFSANALVGAKEFFIKEGMDDILSKPIEVKKLNIILKKWIPKEKQVTI